MGKVKQLEINTEGRLKGCIDIIFEKAIDEPSFSVSYAMMAKHMSQVSAHRNDKLKVVTVKGMLEIIICHVRLKSDFLSFRISQHSQLNMFNHCL